MTGQEHVVELTGYRSDTTRRVMYRAICGCGWKSAGYNRRPNAGIAGQRHLAAVARGEWQATA